MPPPTTTWPSLRGPLHSRNFRLLVACNVISVAGSAVSYVAIPFAVLKIGGSASDVGYVATAKLIPLIALLLLGGVMADRLPRHKVMAAANVLQALAQGTSAMLVLTGQARIWPLVILAAAGGVGAGFYYPAAAGLLPQIVPPEQRARANALNQTGQGAASIAGAAAGGLVIGLAGPGWGLAIDAATFAIAAALRTGMRFPAIPPVQASTMIHDLREGWQEFTARRWLWVIVLLFAFLVAISTGTTDVLGPLVAGGRLGGARSWGYIVAAYSAGAIAGGLVMIRFRPRRMLLAAILSVPAFSAVLFALAVPLAVPLDITASFCAGACLEVFGVSWTTVLQQEIPPEKLSRISSYDALGNCALAPVGIAIAGPLAAAFGTSAVLTAGGALVILLPLLVLLLPEVRHIRRRRPAIASEINPGSALPSLPER
ncbi:MAG: MFS transporter [Streptosporangiaceae bacterium]|jgi:MFS family permease